MQLKEDLRIGKTRERISQPVGGLLTALTLETTSARPAYLGTDDGENIEDDANDGSVVTLDTMRQQIQQNMNYLGSNNPFQHDKLAKPGSKANKMSGPSGALSQRATSKLGAATVSNAKSQIKPKDYFTALS